MSVWSRIRSTFRSLFRKRRLDADLDDELRSYQELLAAEKIRAGMDPDEARRAARHETGGIEQVKERVRERRLGASIDTLAQDVRVGVRSLRSNAGLSAVAILILAVGIGANTTLFSTVSAAVLAGLPYEDSARLVAGVTARDGRGSGPVSRVDWLDYRERAASFEHVALIGTGGGLTTFTGDDGAVLLRMGWVSWNLWPALGVEPELGRGFLPQEEAEGGAASVVISHALWQSRYGGAADALGESLYMDGAPLTIVGVLPASFDFLIPADVWGLIDRDGPWDATRDSHSHWVVGKLAPGVTIDRAQSELDGISAGLQTLYPDTNKNKALAIVPLQEFMVGEARFSLLMLMGTTALVLLIACSNVAGLLLARGHQRMPEMAMRAALGASRGRLVRQLLTESVLLTMLAGSLGAWLAYLAQDLVTGVVPVGDLGTRAPAIDAGVLLFTIAVSVVTGVVVGVVPAFIGASSPPSGKLGTGTRMTTGTRGIRLRGALVVLQVGISVVLLIGAGLLLRSLVQMANVELGFDADNLLTAGLTIQVADYPESEQRAAFYTEFVEEVESLPGVMSASLISKPPILSRWQDWAIWPAEQERPQPGEQFMAMARWASPGYFETARIPLLAGRDLTARDRTGAFPVVVISEAVARALFPDDDPVGRMVGIGWYDDPLEVVGVVGDVHVNSIARGMEPAMYMASAQTGATWLNLMIRTDGAPAALIGPIRDRLGARDANALLIEPITMSAVVGGSLAGFRVIMLSLSGFAGVALLLAAVGLYGLLAYNVTRRTHEIGIRLAMGAARSDLIGMVLRRGLTLVGVGLLAGLAGAAPATLMLRRLLFQTEPLQPSIYAAAATALGLTAVLACLIPAWRATRVDVVEVLKRE